MGSDLVALGLDIGGANVKATKVVKRAEASPSLEGVVREHCPLWVKGVDGLKSKLYEIRSALKLRGGYFVGVCMTAELSDVFRNKREGVASVVEVVENVFNDSRANLYVTVLRGLAEAGEILKEPLKAAAANWAASAWLLERLAEKHSINNAVLIDIGSTTTTVIPLINGKVAVRGLSDPEKLAYGELVYTGVLRTNVATLIDKAPYKGAYVRVSTERFALTGDIHLVLGHIRSEDYTTETADGRGTSVDEALQRLARVPCADHEAMNYFEVRELARYVFESQLFKVLEALIQVRSWIASMGIDPEAFTAITAGIGEFLAREAARRARFARIVSVEEFVPRGVSPVLPAFASALMVLEHAGAEQSRSQDKWAPT